MTVHVCQTRLLHQVPRQPSCSDNQGGPIIPPFKTPGKALYSSLGVHQRHFITIRETECEVPGIGWAHSEARVAGRGFGRFVRHWFLYLELCAFCLVNDNYAIIGLCGFAASAVPSGFPCTHSEKRQPPRQSRTEIRHGTGGFARADARAFDDLIATM